MDFQHQQTHDDDNDDDDDDDDYHYHYHIRYRCRVDFQHQQTQFTSLDLKVVRPPGKPTITTGMFGFCFVGLSPFLVLFSWVAILCLGLVWI